MGSKRIYLVGLAVLILGGIVAGLATLYSQLTEADRQEKAFILEVAALRLGPGVCVKARVKEDTFAGLQKTSWVDVTEEAELLFKLIQPPMRNRDKGRSPEVLCEIKIHARTTNSYSTSSLAETGISGFHSRDFGLDSPVCSLAIPLSITSTTRISTWMKASPSLSLSKQSQRRIKLVSDSEKSKFKHRLGCQVRLPVR